MTFTAAWWRKRLKLITRCSDIAKVTPRARILVVDDDRDLRDLVVFKMNQVGYQVSAADNGMTGLSQAREELPELVILDVMMPGLSGIDVLRELRADPQTRTTRIIVLTARAQEDDTEIAFAEGADDYVVKPFSPRELVRRVEALLRHDR